MSDSSGMDVAEATDPQRIYGDAARRMADAVNVHLAAIGLAAVGKWVACRLSDGGSDGVLYDTRAEAVYHQLHEQLCAYIHVPVSGMNARQAANYLAFTRQQYDNGWRITPDEEDRHPVIPIDYRGGPL